MQSATPGPGGSSSIKRLEAKGNVVVTQKDQVVTGETAIFDTKTNLITMLGGIVLTQGKNVLRGDRLLVDMTTGVSRVESNSGRVQGLFQSSGQGGPLIPGSSPSPMLPPAGQFQQIEIISITCALAAGGEVEARGANLYLRTGSAAESSPGSEGCLAGQAASIASCCSGESGSRLGRGFALKG